jgi:hypothetical protein
MHPMAPARAAELQECPLWLTTARAAAIEARGPGRSAICARNAPAAQDAAALPASEPATSAVRHTAGETIMPGIACARIQLHTDVHDMPACLLMLAGAAEPGPPDRRRACRSTAGSDYRSMARPSGEPAEVAGNPNKPGSAGEPK